MKRRHLFILMILLIGGLTLSDHLLLQRRTVASFEGSAETAEKEKYFDLTDMSSEQFNKSFKHALVQGLHVQKTTETVSVSWGQFLVRNESGGKVYACEKYPYFEMILQAEGVAYSGSVPTLLIRGPCISSDDGQYIQPLVIPLKGLHQHLREKMAYRVDMPGGRDSFILSAQNLYNEWPRYWNVTEVRLSGEHENLSLDGYEIISLLDRPLTLDFAEGQ